MKDAIGHIFQGRQPLAVLQLISQRLVFQVIMFNFGQTEGHMSDEALVFEFIFEDGVAVAEAALRIGEPERRISVEPPALHRFDAILHFRAVGADILHRSTAHIAGNANQVFQSV